MNHHRLRHPRPRWFGWAASGRPRDITTAGSPAATNNHPIRELTGATHTTTATPMAGATTKGTGTAKITNTDTGMPMGMIETVMRATDMATATATTSWFTESAR